jgi:hypothetical protein
MPKFQIKSTALLAIALGLSATAFAQSHPFTSFDAPDATSGTFPMHINNAGQIVGNYISNFTHGFVRNADGQIIEFDAPLSTSTYPRSISSQGQIVGYAQSVNGGTVFGFLRSAHGNFVLIAYPAVTNTYAYSVNDNGAIAGIYSDSAFGETHGFVRDASGIYTSIDAPGAGTGNGQGTDPLVINNDGEIAGLYVDASAVAHGFVRDAVGNITTFDVPDATKTVPADLNDNGDVTGNYIDASGVQNIFIRHADGTFATFALPHVVTASALSINDSGYICGFGEGQFLSPTGFLRDPAGNLFRYSGPQPNLRGTCQSVNDNLHATGDYRDNATGATHGWVK